jgi:hypothetical protein
MKKKQLRIGIMSAMAIGGLSAAPASAFPQFWTNSSKTTLLRSVTTPPLNQPDAMEFVNNGSITLEGNTSGTNPTVICSEVEFGTTMVKNNATEEARLAMPFGVAEGDNCFIAGSTLLVPFYFDTNAAGAGVAYITVGVGPAYVTTIHNLKLSLNISGNWCVAQQVSTAGIQGNMRNWAGPFVEEEPNNLNVQFEKAPVTIVCTLSSGSKVKYLSSLTGNFYVETMSAATDTAWVE